MFQPQFKTLIYFCFLLLTLQVSGQELGFIKRGNHYLQLQKNETNFSLVYSDVNATIKKEVGVINFPNKKTIYDIIMNGFTNSKNHQIIVYTSNDTIVKFEYVKLSGKRLLAIKQNNLSVKTKSKSNYFTKDDFIKLFGTP
jgi:secreted PhoX family phosphatase